MRKAKRKNPFSKKKKFYIKLTLERKGGVIKHVKVYPKACIYTLTTRPNPKKKDVLDGYTFTYKALGQTLRAFKGNKQIQKLVYQKEEA